MFPNRRPFGIPTFVLHSQQLVTQALEVYSGSQIRIDRFQAKTTKVETGLQGIIGLVEHGSEYRDVEVEAGVVGFETPDILAITTKLTLRKWLNGSNGSRSRDWVQQGGFTLNVRRFNESLELSVNYLVGVHELAAQETHAFMVVEKLSAQHHKQKFGGHGIHDRKPIEAC